MGNTDGLRSLETGHLVAAGASRPVAMKRPVTAADTAAAERAHIAKAVVSP